MKFKCLLALSVTLLFAGTTLSQAGMYKYKDEKGVWVYSQHPPAEGDFISIKAQKKPRGSNLSSKARTERITKARESVIGSPKENKKKDKIAKETAKNEITRAENCERAKKALASLQVYRRFKDKDGNVTRLTDDDREKRLQRSKDDINEFCD